MKFKILFIYYNFEFNNFLIRFPNICGFFSFPKNSGFANNSSKEKKLKIFLKKLKL